jgi:hypothetical protein
MKERCQYLAGKMAANSPPSGQLQEQKFSLSMPDVGNRNRNLWEQTQYLYRLLPLELEALENNILFPSIQLIAAGLVSFSPNKLSTTTI